MQYKNESQLNLRFLKTFALAAERLADAGAGQNVPVGQYAEYVKTLSTEYPALENLALKLNVQYGSSIQIPDVIKEDDYRRSQAFVALSRAVAEEMKQRFTGVRPWYDGNFGALPQQLEAANVNASNSHNNYWLSHALHLSLSEVDVKKSEIEQQMYDEIDRIRLSDQVAVIMKDYGLVVEEEQDGDIYDMLCEVGYEILSSKKKIDSEQVAISLRGQIQENWDFADNNDRFLFSLMEPMNILGQVVRGQQKKSRVWDNSAYSLKKVYNAIANVPKHEQVEEYIYPLAKPVSTDEVNTWADGKVMPDYLNGVDDGKIQQINTESLFWKNYEDAGNVFHTPEWQERIGLVLGGWSEMLWEETSEIEERLDEFWDEKSDSEDDDEKDFSSHDENMQIFKEEALAFAKKFVILAEVAEKYKGIVLNDTGISLKTLDEEAKKDGIDDETSRVLELIINAFDKNYDLRDFFAKETVLEEGEDAAVFIRKLAELPHSPAKREIANLMLQSFSEQKKDIDSEDEIVTGNFVEQIELIQQDKNEILQDFVGYAISTYPELSEKKADVFANDFSYAVNANFIIPLYLDIEPFSGAREKILEELDGYENYSPEAKNFMGGLFDNYLKAIKPLHEENKTSVDEILFSGDELLIENDPMAFVITEYTDVMRRSDDMQQNIDVLRDISQSEEAVYRKYAAFQEKRDMYYVADKDLRKALIQAKIFVR